jgi:hypothetical protein
MPMLPPDVAAALDAALRRLGPSASAADIDAVMRQFPEARPVPPPLPPGAAPPIHGLSPQVPPVRGITSSRSASALRMAANRQIPGGLGLVAGMGLEAASRIAGAAGEYAPDWVPEGLKGGTDRKVNPELSPDSAAAMRQANQQAALPKALQDQGLVNAPPRAALMAVVARQMAKDAEKAGLASRAVEALAAEREGRVGPPPKVPAPSADEKRPAIGTGPGAVAETPQKAGTIGATNTIVKLPGGRVVMGNSLDDARAAGGENISFQDAMASQRFGAPQAERFMRGRTSRMTETPQDRFSSSPYSTQVRALANADPEASPETSLSFAGDTNFGTSGDRRLSGLEQALARRTWLEGRADTEQAGETERAELDRRERLAEMDPLEMARIQAEGRAGPGLARVELDLRARKEAERQFAGISRQIDELDAQLEGAEPGYAADIRQRISYLERTRIALANLLLGQRLTDPRSAADAFGSVFSGFGQSGGGAPTPGAP